MGRLYRGGKVLSLRGIASLGLLYASFATAEARCPALAAPAGEEVNISAGEARWQADGLLELTGGVEVRYGDGLTLQTDALSYQDNHATAPGTTSLRGPGIQLTGTQFEYRDGVLRAHGVRFTPCPSPRPDWSLGAGRLTLDRARGWGRAWNTTVRVLDVPILWLPYLDFPLNDQRKSGFLYPRFSESGNSGLEFSLPYYWNLAPARDLTLTLRASSRRGAMPAVEYRYLRPTGGGRLYTEFLPADAADGDRFRGRFTATLNHQRGPLRFSMAADRTTDREYLADLSDRLANSSTRYLEQLGELRYQQDNTTAWLRLEEFQSLIADTAAPHARVPGLGVEWAAAGRRLRYTFSGRLARFSGTGADGLRLYAHPRLDWELRAPWGFLIPRAGLRYTAYRLDDKPSRLSTTLPVLELDAGLLLERPLRAGSWLHVLEPRLHYRYVPFKDQSAQPLYDTAALDYSARALFMPDRHTGPDRIGDTNRLALGVRTSLHGPGGVEWGNLSLGRLYFLRHRRVRPDGVGPLAERVSPWLQALEISGPGAFSMTQESHFNPGDGGLTRLAASMRYRPDSNLDMQAGWRARRGRSQPGQGELAARWAISPTWEVNGSYRHATDPGRLLEAGLDIVYRSCCWNLRMGAGRYLSTGDTASYNNRVYVEFGIQAGQPAGER